MTREISRGRLLGAAAAGIFMFGVVMALLGATLLPLAERVHLNAARSGDVFLVMNFGIFLALAGSGPSLDKFGTRPVLLSGALLLGSGLLLLAGAETFAVIAVSVFCIGLGGGALNTGANALVADAYPEERGRALNVLGIFFGFGAIAMPFAIGTISSWFSLAQILAVASVLPLACAVLYGVLPFPAAREARGFRLVEALQLAREPGVLLFAFLLFFQSGNEFTMGGWIPSFAARETGATMQVATLVVSCYWAAMMLGRWVSARVLARVGSAKLVAASGALAAASTALLVSAHSTAVAAIAAALVGFAYAAVYPTTLGMAGDRFPRFPGTLFGLLFSIALIGGMSFPWLAGHVAQSFGYRMGLLLPLAGAVGVAVLAMASVRLRRS